MPLAIKYNKIVQEIQRENPEARITSVDPLSLLYYAIGTRNTAIITELATNWKYAPNYDGYIVTKVIAAASDAVAPGATGGLDFVKWCFAAFNWPIGDQPRGSVFEVITNDEQIIDWVIENFDDVYGLYAPNSVDLIYKYRERIFLPQKSHSEAEYNAIIKYVSKQRLGHMFWKGNYKQIIRNQYLDIIQHLINIGCIKRYLVREIIKELAWDPAWPELHSGPGPSTWPGLHVGQRREVNAVCPNQMSSGVLTVPTRLDAKLALKELLQSQLSEVKLDFSAFHILKKWPESADYLCRFNTDYYDIINIAKCSLDAVNYLGNRFRVQSSSLPSVVPTSNLMNVLCSLLRRLSFCACTSLGLKKLQLLLASSAIDVAFTNEEKYKILIALETCPPYVHWFIMNYCGGNMRRFLTLGANRGLIEPIGYLSTVAAVLTWRLYEFDMPKALKRQLVTISISMPRKQAQECALDLLAQLCPYNLFVRTCT